MKKEMQKFSMEGFFLNNVWTQTARRRSEAVPVSSIPDIPVSINITLTNLINFKIAKCG
jgi:hypothetical protein